MSPFHFCLSAARNLSSFQLLPASLITDLLQLFFGLPLFLFPWGFQSRAAFGTSPSSFLNVWPIHLSFLFLISKFISSCPVTFLRSLGLSFVINSKSKIILQFVHTRVGTLIVATIYLQLIQNRYMFRSFTVLQCSHQDCVQPVASDVEVVGYL